MPVVYAIARCDGPTGQPLYAIIASDSCAYIIQPDGTAHDEKSKRLARLMKIAKRLPEDAYGWVRFFGFNMTYTHIGFPVKAESDVAACAEAVERMAEWRPKPSDALAPAPYERKI